MADRQKVPASDCGYCDTLPRISYNVFYSNYGINARWRDPVWAPEASPPRVYKSDLYCRII
jgi:hypothetical protein